MITLKTLPQASAQEVFDQVARHLLTQGVKSQLNDPSDVSQRMCAYRGDNNLMCAAGCLIADDEYTHDMDGGCSWAELEVRGWVPDTHEDMIYHLQTVHDEHDPEEWSYYLREVAKFNNLNTDVLREFGGD